MFVKCACRWQTDGHIEMLYEQMMACLSGSVLLPPSLMDHQSSVSPIQNVNIHNTVNGIMCLL